MKRNSERKKVVIIGAGFAGSFAAYLLAKKLPKRKFAIFVVEKNIKAAEKKCPRLLTKRFFTIDSSLRSKDLGKKCITNKISNGIIVSKNNYAKITFSSPEIVVSPSRLINFFLDKAIESNAKIINADFLGFFRKNEKIIIRLKGKRNKRTFEMEADFLIDASGASSIISKKLGNRLKFRNAIQAEILIKKGLQKKYWVAYLDLAAGNLIWIFFPEKSSKKIVVSYTTTTPKPREFVYRKFKKILEKLGTRKILKIEMAKIPIWNSNIVYGNDKIFLLGDAVGHVKMSTFGGIVPSFLAAKALSEVISKEGNALEYTKKIRQLNNELWLHAFISSLLSKISDRDCDEIVEVLKEEKKIIESRDNLSRSLNYFKLLKLSLSKPKLFFYFCYFLLFSFLKICCLNRKC